MHGWVWTRGAGLVGGEEITHDPTPVTRKQLRLSWLKSQVRSRLVHSSTILLDQYRTLLGQPPLLNTGVWERIRSFYEAPAKKRKVTQLTRAQQLHKRLLTRGAQAHALWWWYRGKLIPSSLELDRYKTHFGLYSAYRLP